MNEKHEYDYRIGDLSLNLTPDGNFTASLPGCPVALTSRSEVAKLFAGKIITVCMSREFGANEKAWQSQFRISHGCCAPCAAKWLAGLEKAA